MVPNICAKAQLELGLGRLTCPHFRTLRGQKCHGLRWKNLKTSAGPNAGVDLSCPLAHSALYWGLPATVSSRHKLRALKTHYTL